MVVPLLRKLPAKGWQFYRPWVWEERSKGKECESAGQRVEEGTVFKVVPLQKEVLAEGST